MSSLSTLAVATSVMLPLSCTTKTASAFMTARSFSTSHHQSYSSLFSLAPTGDTPILPPPESTMSNQQGAAAIVAQATQAPSPLLMEDQDKGARAAFLSSNTYLADPAAMMVPPTKSLRQKLVSRIYCMSTSLCRLAKSF
jgi:hypothetical protein